MTHGPPHKILDFTTSQDHAGCESLLARLPTLRPRLHLFGHIHEAHGAQIHHWDGNPSITDDGVVTDSNLDTDFSQAPMATRGLGSTVFVNAANWPAGGRVRRDGKKVEFGGGEFQPVVVDLRNDA